LLSPAPPDKPSYERTNRGAADNIQFNAGFYQILNDTDMGPSPRWPTPNASPIRGFFTSRPLLLTLLVSYKYWVNSRESGTSKKV
jgi:hypothetical protein